MEINKDARKRSPEFGSNSKICDIESAPGSLGEISGISGKYGTNKVAASRDDSHRRDTLTSREQRVDQADGKIIDQLADEVEKEISYHESQASQLKSRLKQLRQLSGELEKTDNSD